MSEGHGEVTVRLRRTQGYGFEITYGDGAETVLASDEPPPLGAGQGPSPGMLLASAVANCLASSLLFCLGKRGAEVGALEAEAKAVTGRNAEGRLRILKVAVRLRPELAEEHAEALAKCERVFEQFCTVTASVKDGIDIEAVVEGPDGTR
jgi:organic hydroperoxide reductase OsmC/OhrA